MNSCELGRWETGSVGGNKITFDGNLGDTGNPLKFPFQKWPVKMYLNIKVTKTARNRNRYNQAKHLSQDTKWESTKITINITNKSQEASSFPSDDHKAAMNRRESMTNTRHK